MCTNIGAKVRIAGSAKAAQGWRRVARVVIGHHCLREREPFVPALRHALGACDLDDRGAHGPISYFASCLPKKANTLLQPSIACSGRYNGRCQ